MRRAAFLLLVVASVGVACAPESPASGAGRRSVFDVFSAASSGAGGWGQQWMGPRKNRPTTIPQFAAASHPGADPAFVAAISSLPEKIQDTRIGLVDSPSRGAEEAMRGKSVCAVFPAFSVATCLNTAASDRAERSRKMVSDTALPLMRGLAAKLPGTECLGVGLSYGAADLSRKSGMGGEFVAIVALTKDVAALARGEIAEGELLRRADLYALYVDSPSLAKIETGP